MVIELVARRAQAVPPSLILDRLDDALGVLDGVPMGGGHETLGETLRRSYDRLTASEQSLLRRLAVFRGGFSLELAERVCADEAGSAATVLRDLVRLADRSLLEVEARDGEVRYRLLEIVRQLGSHELRVAPGQDEGRAEERYLTWCLELADRLADDASAAGEVAADRGHLEWALAHCRRVGRTAEAERLARLLAAR
jgi:non-specific serine/threonine protein kinase